MSMIGQDSLKTRRTLTVDGKDYAYFSIEAAARRWARTSPACR